MDMTGCLLQNSGHWFLFLSITYSVRWQLSGFFLALFRNIGDLFMQNIYNDLNCTLHHYKMIRLQPRLRDTIDPQFIIIKNISLSFQENINHAV